MSPPRHSRLATPARDLAAEWVAVEELHRWAKNPRKIGKTNVDEARRSLQRFGFGAPIVAWRERNMIVAGHARMAGMLELLREDPELKTAENGTLRASLGPTPRHVPVRYRSFTSEQEAEAYALRDNNAIGAWDDERLAELLKGLQAQEIDLDGLGWSERELLKLVGPPGGGLGGVDEEPGPLTSDPQPKLGEVYELGPHRLVCGDSTDAGAWDLLLRGEKVQLVWTDPPYGVDYVGKTADALTIENDALPDDKLLALLVASMGMAKARSSSGCAFYVASPAGRRCMVFQDALTELGVFEHTLIWAKDQFVMSRCDYHYQHEPIFYGWTDGHHYFTPERTHSSLLEFARPRRNDIHPTMKPVELVRYCIRNSSKPGWLVADPFGGSGTTLIAAASEGRVARLIELDPRYCDAIRKRWTTFAESAGAEPGEGALR